MKFRLQLISIIALSATLACASHAWADYNNALNINFAGSPGDAAPATPSNYDPSTTPINSLILGNLANGAIGTQQNTNGYVWNNVTSNTGTVGNGSTGQLYSGGSANAVVSAQNYLYESQNGAAIQVPTTVTFNSGETWSNTVANNYGPIPNGNSLLLSNYLEGSNFGGAATVTIGNIPAPIANNTGGYTVAVYVAGNNMGSSGDLSDYTLSYTGLHSGTIGPLDVATGPVYTFTAATGSTQGNLISFALPQGATGFTLTANSPNGEATNSFSPIDGLSLYTPFIHVTPPPGTPEPGSLLLMGLGALGLAAVARRRRNRKA